MSSYMKWNSCGRSKTSWYFLKNYSMISTDPFQVGFLNSLTIFNEEPLLTIVNEGSSLTIVKEGSSLAIVNKGLSLTIVNKATSFIKTIVSFSIFVIVFITKRSFLKKMKTLTSLDPAYGQKDGKELLTKNPAAYINPYQPLMQIIKGI